jgi:hypothetical protein
MQVERGKSSLLDFPSGGRVSNTWATCPMVGDNREKFLLIPHNTIRSHDLMVKDFIAIGWARGALASW